MTTERRIRIITLLAAIVVMACGFACLAGVLDNKTTGIISIIFSAWLFYVTTCHLGRRPQGQ
jgi:hypothetical protein